MTTPWGGRIVYRPETTSTMDDAQRLEDEGLPDGSAAWAGFQSAGRGRHPGRSWTATAGENLLITFYWAAHRFRASQFAPSLTVALGLCFWLESLRLEAQVHLKWPNDVYVNERKIAGILVRQRWSALGPGTLHAGIGINLRSPSSHHSYRTPPGSLQEFGSILTPEQALRGLLPALERSLDLGDPRTEVEARLWRKGQPLALSTPGDEGRARSGVVQGIDDQGRLLWVTEGVLQVLSSGE